MDQAAAPGARRTAEDGCAWSLRLGGRRHRPSSGGSLHDSDHIHGRPPRARPSRRSGMPAAARPALLATGSSRAGAGQHLRRGPPVLLPPPARSSSRTARPRAVHPNMVTRPRTPNWRHPGERGPRRHHQTRRAQLDRQPHGGLPPRGAGTRWTSPATTSPLGRARRGRRRGRRAGLPDRLHPVAPCTATKWSEPGRT